MHVHELLDQLLQDLVVEIELALQGAEGQTPVPLQQGTRFLDRLDEAHGSPPSSHNSLPRWDIEINAAKWSRRAGAQP